MNRRVVITAANMVTSLGNDIEASWRGLAAGESGVRPIERFDPTGLPVTIAAELLSSFWKYSEDFVSRRISRQMARATVMGVVCAKVAIEQSHLNFADFDRRRCAVVFGGADTGHSAVDNQDYWILKTMPHSVPALLSMEYGLQGPSLLISCACASSSSAIAIGYDMIESGQVDVAVVGGSSSLVNPEHILGFCELGALSLDSGDPRKASRPFSQGRNGFVIGEGAGTLVLESEDTARLRGAPRVGTLLGHSVTNEAYNLMSPRPNGDGMALTMQGALNRAGLTSGEVDYINAHGTSTVQNDRYETMAVKQVFGERAPSLPVSSSKSMIGHTGGACGAVEAVVTLCAMREQVLPPTINYDPDPELDLDYVPNDARSSEIRIALSNSYGFGGCNCSLVFGDQEFSKSEGS